jgi:hypothetical protein
VPDGTSDCEFSSQFPQSKTRNFEELAPFCPQAL